MRYKDMDFDGPLTESLAGPLVGGSVTQIGTLATKLIWKDNAKMNKWAPAIGFGLGALVSGILAFRRSTRTLGIAGLVTAGLVAIPRQLENLMMGAGTHGAFGVITPEQMQGSFGEGSPVELLDSGNGSYNGMGVAVAEQGMGQPSPVEMLGNSSFGANFASVGR